MIEKEKFGKRFIEILEIIYAIIFACGVAQMLEEIFVNTSDNSHPLQIISTVIVSIFVLIRFFFAPSKNVKVLVTKSNKKGRKCIMPFDIVILIAHSFIFYFMCLEIENIELFYLGFFGLLAWNAVWLFSIRKRLKRSGLKEENLSYMEIWSKNNIIFFAIYLLSLALYFNPYFSISVLAIGIIWFILAITNSLWDLVKTYDDYFAAD